MDATVIAGVLILLTLSNIFGHSKFEGITKISLTLASILPFAGSAIAIGLGNFSTHGLGYAFKDAALTLMVAGFSYLIVIFVVLLRKLQTSVKK